MSRLTAQHALSNQQTERLPVSATGGSEAETSRPPPSSANGTGHRPAACKCGRPIRTDTGRCTRGHVQRGNGLAVVSGSRSLAFWRDVAEAQAALVAAVVSDAGHTPDTAPRALLEAVSGLSQAVLVRDSAFARMAEEGGGLTSTGRGRRCLSAWVQAQAAVERHLRLIGLRREPKPIDPLAAVRAAVATANDTLPPSVDTSGISHPPAAARVASQTVSSSSGARVGTYDVPGAPTPGGETDAEGGEDEDTE